MMNVITISINVVVKTARPSGTTNGSFQMKGEISIGRPKTAMRITVAVPLLPKVWRDSGIAPMPRKILNTLLPMAFATAISEGRHARWDARRRRKK